jgi:hypothetical protein
MIVELTGLGIRVHEADDCTRLSVTTALAGLDVDTALRASGAGARDGSGDHLLLDVPTLHGRAREAASSSDWESRWTAMIDYAARKGWLSPDGSAVRVHLESPSAPDGRGAR